MKTPVVVLPQAAPPPRGWLAPWIAAVVAAALSALLQRYGLPPLPPLPPLQQQPPAAPPAAPAKPDRNPTAAIGRIQFGNFGCSATLIGPRRADGRWDVLTAAHCIPLGATQGVMTLRDGRKLAVSVTASDKRSDACWLVTVANTHADLPHAALATTAPAKGTRVFHCGFGVDRPGNREEGVVVHPSDSDGQTEYLLAVSSGDSGGGICVIESGEVLSPVCCATEPGAGQSRVWGASPEAAWRLRNQVADFPDDWKPLPLPMRPK